MPPVRVRKKGLQSGSFGMGEDPDTRIVQQAINRAIEDVNRRLSDLTTGALKLHPWTVAVIAGGMAVTLAGSLLWLFAPVTCG